MAVSLEAWGPPFPMHHLCTLHHGTGCLCLASPENQLHVCWRDGCVLWAAEAWEIVGGFDPLSHPDTPVPPFRLPPGARAIPLAHSLSSPAPSFKHLPKSLCCCNSSHPLSFVDLGLFCPGTVCLWHRVCQRRDVSMSHLPCVPRRTQLADGSGFC